MLACAPGEEPSPPELHLALAERLPLEERRRIGRGVQEKPGIGPALTLEGGEGRLEIDLPEALWSHDRALNFVPVRRPPRALRTLADGYVFEDASVAVEARWAVADDVASMQLAVTNPGEEVAKDVRTQVCMRLDLAPVFRHQRARRVWVFPASGRASLEFARLRELDGYGAFNMWTQRFHEERLALAGELNARRRESPLYSRSGVLSADGVVVVTSEDGGLAVGALWEQAWKAFHNFAPGHQCIHSDPSFGDVAPGETVRRRGWVVLVRGGPEMARQRLLELAAASGPP